MSSRPPEPYGRRYGLDPWSIDWDRVPPAELVERPAGEQSLRPSRRPAPGRRRLLLSLIAVNLVLVAGAAAWVVLRDDGGGSATPDRGSAASPERTRALPTYPEREPFVVSGARFNVLGSPEQDWTQVVDSVSPGRGREWQTVAVLVRNLSRRDLAAGDLRFRLRDARGRRYAPDPRVGNRGLDPPRGTRLARGTLVHANLAFAARTGSGRFELLIDASPRVRVRVPLTGS